MKTIEHITKTKYKIYRRFYKTKRFQGFVFSIDFDVPQAINKTICVITFKFIFLGFWIALESEKVIITRLSKYKSGGIVPGNYFRLYCFECEIEMPVKETNQGRFCSNCGLRHC